jgi:hypothetical protein
MNTRHPVCFVLDMHMHHVFLDWTDESRTCMRYDELGFCLLLRCEWAWTSSYGDVCFTLTQASRCMHSRCLLSSSREGGIYTRPPYKTTSLLLLSFVLFSLCIYTNTIPLYFEQRSPKTRHFGKKQCAKQQPTHALSATANQHVHQRSAQSPKQQGGSVRTAI